MDSTLDSTFLTDGNKDEMTFIAIDIVRLQEQSYVELCYAKSKKELNLPNVISRISGQDLKDIDIEQLCNESDSLVPLLEEVFSIDSFRTPSIIEKRLALIQWLLKSIISLPHTSVVDHSSIITNSEEVNQLMANDTHEDIDCSLKSRDGPSTIEALPMTTQVGIKILFSLLKSISRRRKNNGNYHILVKLVHHLPDLLERLPSLSLYNIPPDDRNELLLRGDGGASISLSNNIIQELYEILISVAETSCGKLPVESTDREHCLALTALVGLAIKRGYVREILSVIKLLLLGPFSLSAISLATVPFLMELKNAAAETSESSSTSKIRGKLMSFGKGDHGKLGHGICNHPQCTDGNCVENKFFPTQIDAIQDVVITNIDSLSTHSVAITSTGDLLTWGNGDKNRLGHGSTSKYHAPCIVESFRGKASVKDVACGLGHTIALLSYGVVYSWGNGGNGRLGLGDTSDRATPTLISTLEFLSVKAVFSGASHSLAISTKGYAYSWGKNNQGQCGHGHTNDQHLPLKIATFDTDIIQQLCGGWEHSLALTNEGKTYSFGSGYKDSRRVGIPPVLGHGNSERQLSPMAVSALAEEVIVHIACGWDHSLAVSSSGALYTWGSGTNGKLGHGDDVNVSVPTVVSALKNRIVIQAEAGCEHTVAITDSGELYTWGHGDSGRLGHGDCRTEFQPRLVESLVSQGLKTLSVAVGDKYNLIVVQSGANNSKLATSMDMVDCNQDKGETEQIPRTNCKWLNQHRDLEVPTYEEALIGRTTTALIMLNHLARLSFALIPIHTISHSTVFQEKDYIMKNGTSISSKNEYHYVVDCSLETFSILLSIMEKFLDPSVAQTAIEANLQGQMESNVEESPEACEDNLKHIQSNISPIFARFVVYWTCFSILKANIYNLKKSKSYYVNSELQSVLISIEKVVYNVVNVPMFNAKKDYHENCGFDSEMQMENAYIQLQKEAADIIKIGFNLFYPLQSDQRSLLWDLLHTPNPTRMLLQTIIDRLSQCSVVRSLVEHVFHKNSPSCTNGKYDSYRSNSSKSTAYHNTTEDISPQKFSDLLLELLHRCLESSYSPSSDINEDTLPKKKKNPYIQLCSSLQLHLFSLWSVEGLQHNAAASPVHFCIVNFMQKLLTLSIETIQNLGKEERSTDEQSLLASILPLALESLSLCPISNVFILKLLPHCIQLLRMLDELNQSRNIFQWLRDLEDSCALVIGRYTRILIDVEVSQDASEKYHLLESNLIFGGIENEELPVESIHELQDILTWEKKYTFLLADLHYDRQFDSAQEFFSGASFPHSPNCRKAPSIQPVISSQDAVAFLDDLILGKGVSFKFHTRMLALVTSEGKKAVVNENKEATLLGIDDKKAISDTKYSQIGDDSELSPRQMSQSKINSCLRDKAGRAVIAVLLKYNGCITEAVTTARSSATPTSSSPLLNIWRAGCFVSHFLLRLGSESKGKFNDTCNSLQVTAQTIICNSRFLLLCKPTHSIDLDFNEKASFSELLQKFPQVNSSLNGNLLETTVKLLHKLEIPLDAINATNSPSSCTIPFLLFLDILLKPTDLEKLKLSLHRKKIQGQIRVIGLKIVDTILSCLTISSAKAFIIQGLPNAFSPLLCRNTSFCTTFYTPFQDTKKEMSSLYSYLKGIEGCGIDVSMQLFASFENVYWKLSKLLQDPSSDFILQVAILKAFAIDFYPKQQPNIAAFNIVYKTNIIGILGQLLANSASMVSTGKFEGKVASLQEDKTINERKNEQLHHLSWIILHLLTFQLCNLHNSNDICVSNTHPLLQDLLQSSQAPSVIQDSNPRTMSLKVSVSSRLSQSPKFLSFSRFSINSSLVLNPRLGLYDLSNSANPLAESIDSVYLLLFTELSRIQNELQFACEGELTFNKLMEEAHATKLLFNNELAFFKHTHGRSFTDIHLSTPRNNDARQSGFSLSFWIKPEVPSLLSNKYDSSQDLIPKTLVFVRTLPEKFLKTFCEQYPAAYLTLKEGKVYFECTMNGILFSRENKEMQETSPTVVSLEMKNPLVEGKWNHLGVVFYHLSKKLQIYHDGVLDNEMTIEGDNLPLERRTIHIGGVGVDASILGSFQATNLSLNSPHGHLDDFLYFSSSLNAQDFTTIQSYGMNVQRIIRRKKLDNYCYRMISLLYILADSTVGMNQLSSSRWTALLVTVLQFASAATQYQTLRLFSKILPSIKPDSLLVPSLSNGTFLSQPIVAGSGLNAAVMGRGPQGILDYLFSTLGIAWKSEGLLKTLSTNDDQAHISNCNSRFSMINQVVFIVHELSKNPVWTTHLRRQFSNALLAIPNVVLPSRKVEGVKEKLKRGYSNDLWSIVTTLYSLGGFIEYMRIGSLISYVSDRVLNVYSLGTIVECNAFKQTNKDTITVRENLTRETINVPLSDVRLVSNIVPNTSLLVLQTLHHNTIHFLFDNVPSLESNILQGTHKYDDGYLQEEMEIDSMIVMYSHVRAGFFRTLRNILRCESTLNEFIRGDGIFVKLLAQATLNISKSPYLSLGNNIHTASQLPSVAALMSSLRQASCLDSLEALSIELWGRLTSSICNSPWYVHLNSQYIQVLGGEVELDNLMVKGIRHFSSIRLGGVSLEERSGVWYYEVILLSDGLMQIGWGDSEFIPDPLQGLGVGDNMNSFAYDGFRRKKWNASSEDYGERWKVGDVVGCLLDRNVNEICYFLNGRHLGIAFSGFSSKGLYPAVSLNTAQCIQFNFGLHPFMHSPLTDFKPLSNADLPTSNGNSKMFCQDSKNSIDIQQNGFIDSLIEMGFPLEWAIKCARQNDANLTESGIIAWIVEQMKAEATKTEKEGKDGMAVSNELFSHIYVRQYLAEVSKTSQNSGGLKMDERSQLDNNKRECTRQASIMGKESQDFSIMPSDDDLLPTEEFCEEIYQESYFQPQEKCHSKISHLTSYLNISQTARDEELGILYVITNTALTILYSREAVITILLHLSQNNNLLFETVCEHLCHFPRVFIDVIKLILFSGFYQEHHSNLKNALKVYFEKLNSKMDDDRQRFLLALFEDAKNQIINTKESDQPYGELRLQGGLSDKAALCELHVEYGSWMLELLFRQASTRVEKIIQEHNFDESLLSVLIPAICKKALDFQTYSILLQACLGPNLTVRVYLLQLLSITVDTIHHQFNLLVESKNEDYAINSLESWYGAHPTQYIEGRVLRKLKQIITERYWKEKSHRVLGSKYLQSLFNFMSCCVRLEQSICPSQGFFQIELGIELRVEEINPTVVSISWGNWSKHKDSNTENQTTISNSIVLEMSTNNGSFKEIVQISSWSGTYSIENLQPDVLYKFRLMKEELGDDIPIGPMHDDVQDTKKLTDQVIVDMQGNESAIDQMKPDQHAGKLLLPTTTRKYSNVVELLTPPQVVFMFDPDKSGKNLSLSNNNFTVTNRVNKKWNTVKTTSGFSKGVHCWEVHIDKCVSKNIFIGVMENTGSLDNYVGSDMHGYGYLANKAIWYNKSKLSGYGELYKEDDRVGVVLNMDLGTLIFSRNGRDLGVAADGLKGELFLAISLYNKDDSVTLIHTNENLSSKLIQNGGGLLSKSYTIHCNCMEILNGKINSTVLRKKIHQKYNLWKQNAIQCHRIGYSEFADINITTKACNKYGVNRGDVITTTKGLAKVIGVYNHNIWLKVEGSNYATPMSLKEIREKAFYEEIQLVKEDVDDLLETPLNECLMIDDWTPMNNAKLISFLQLLSSSLGMPSPLQLDYQDIILHSDSILGLFNDANLTIEKCLLQITLLNYLNCNATHVLWLLNFTTPSTLHSSYLTTKYQDVIYTNIKENLLRKHLNHTMTCTKTQEESFEFPPEMIELTVFSKARIETSLNTTIQSSSRTTEGMDSVFDQVYQQLKSVDTSELRRQYIARSANEIQPRTFNVKFDGEASLEDSLAFRLVFLAISEEVQSTIHPLFILPNSNPDEKYQVNQFCSLHPLTSQPLAYHSTTNINAIDPASGWNNPIHHFIIPERLKHYFVFGQLMGIALRCQVELPLRLSLEVWKSIVNGVAENIDSHCHEFVQNLKNLYSMGVNQQNFLEFFNGLHFLSRSKVGILVELKPNGIQQKVTLDNVLEYANLVEKCRKTEDSLHLNAIRSGFLTVVSYDIISLFNCYELERMLCSPPVLDISFLKARVIFDGVDSSSFHIQEFWKVLEVLKLEEKRLLLWSIQPLDLFRFHDHVRISITIKYPNDSIGQDHDKLPVTIDSKTSTIYLPNYSSREILHRKLLQAIQIKFSHSQ